jgi:hypothetical protein
MARGWIAGTMIAAALAPVVVGGCTEAADDDGGADALGTAEEALRHQGRHALFVSRDDRGLIATYIDGPGVPTDLRGLAHHPFFRSIGSNGRACIHCHVPSAAWTITPEAARLRFTNPLDVDDPQCLADPTRCRAERDPRRFGLDPLFRTVDGANSPRADVSTAEKRWDAYSMLLTKGLIRVGLPIPAGAEFTLVAVDDPYHYASAQELSLFRRPLPSTNLAAPGDADDALGPTLSTVMWDGRESFAHHDTATALLEQANDATTGHAQATRALTADERARIVAFESSLHTAQIVDERAGDLRRHGAEGGPRALARQPFYLGINDVLTGDAHSHQPFDPEVFDLYAAWGDSHDRDRARIARGEQIFDTRQFDITGVHGLNDDLGAPTIRGTCTTCHDSPGLGHHSVALPIDIGVADGARRTPDLPLYTLRNLVTGETVKTTDPGRALVTGKWKDIGKFKGPILRGLAARAPYFHNGAAAELSDVVEFYDGRFAIGLSERDQRDLVAFLGAL